MANINAPFGFRLQGRTSDVKVSPYLVVAGDTAPLGIGDPVKLTGTSEAVADFGGGNLPIVARAAAGDRLRGIVIGFDPYLEVAYNSVQLGVKHRLASTRRIAYVVDDRDAEFVCQMDASGTAAVTDVGAAFDTITAADCNSITGVSVSALAQTTVSSSAGQFKLLRFVGDPLNEVGDYVRCVVRINEHVDSTEAAV